MLYIYTLFTHTPYPSVSRAVSMEDYQQGVLYYQALVANGLLEGDPIMIPGEEPGLGSEEYVETNYDFRESEEEMEEVENITEVPNEPPTSERTPDHPAAPEDLAARVRYLEEEVSALR